MEISDESAPYRYDYYDILRCICSRNFLNLQIAWQTNVTCRQKKNQQQQKKKTQTNKTNKQTKKKTPSLPHTC